MKRIAIAALVATLVAPAAFATQFPQLLTNNDISEIRAVAPNADLSNLTFDQAARLSAALHGGKGTHLGAEVRSILN